MTTQTKQHVGNYPVDCDLNIWGDFDLLVLEVSRTRENESFPWTVTHQGFLLNSKNGSRQLLDDDEMARAYRHFFIHASVMKEIGT